MVSINEYQNVNHPFNNSITNSTIRKILYAIYLFKRMMKLLGSCVFGIGNNSSCDTYYSLFDCSCLVELIELAGRFASVCLLLVQVEQVVQVEQIADL